MADFAFVESWRIPAPIQLVWDEIQGIEHWPEWWPTVEHVETLEAGDSRGLGSVRRIGLRGPFRFRTSISVRTTRIEAPTVLEGVAVGALTGWGCWQLTGDGRETSVRLDWRFDRRLRWPKALLPLARPFYRWVFSTVMQDGQLGLLRRLQRELVG